MENVKLRKIALQDVDDILRIYSAITQAPASPDYRRVVEQHAREDSDSCFVAEMNGGVAGYIISYTVTGGFGVDKSAWIPMLGVDPNFMGQGIGKAMAEAALSYYRQEDVKKVYTSVRWYDADLLSFFRTLGFDRSEFVNLKISL